MSEDWQLHVHRSCNALDTYVSSSTRYSPFEVVYLHKPADLTHIEYSLLQHLSRFLDDYMRNMKKRFDLMKKIVLEKRTHYQSVQQIMQI